MSVSPFKDSPHLIFQFVSSFLTGNEISNLMLVSSSWRNEAFNSLTSLHINFNEFISLFSQLSSSCLLSFTSPTFSHSSSSSASSSSSSLTILKENENFNKFINYLLKFHNLRFLTILNLPSTALSYLLTLNSFKKIHTLILKNFILISKNLSNLKNYELPFYFSSILLLKNIKNLIIYKINIDKNIISNSSSSSSSSSSSTSSTNPSSNTSTSIVDTVTSIDSITNSSSLKNEIINSVQSRINILTSSSSSSSSISSSVIDTSLWLSLMILLFQSLESLHLKNIYLINDNDIEKITKNLKNLKELIINNSFLIRKPIINNKNLEKISFLMCSNFQIFSNIINNQFTSLISLDFSMTSIKSPDLELILGSTNRLKFLKLCQCLNLKNDLSIISSSLISLEIINSIYIKKLYINTPNLISLRLELINSLNYLYIYSLDIEKISFSMLNSLKFLKLNCKMLRKIKIYGCNNIGTMTLEDLKEISNWFYYINQKHFMINNENKFQQISSTSSSLSGSSSSTFSSNSSGFSNSFPVSSSPSFSSLSSLTLPLATLDLQNFNQSPSTSLFDFLLNKLPYLVKVLLISLLKDCPSLGPYGLGITDDILMQIRKDLKSNSSGENRIEKEYPSTQWTTTSLKPYLNDILQLFSLLNDINRADLRHEV